MFEILCVIAFAWIFFKVLKLFFKIAWGITKIIAMILFITAIPSLLACVFMASGIALLIPVGLVGLAFGILRACM